VNYIIKFKKTLKLFKFKRKLSDFIILFQ
jgi:hypothetical protein